LGQCIEANGVAMDIFDRRCCCQAFANVSMKKPTNRRVVGWLGLKCIINNKLPSL
jgi:hypothetical protein